MVAISVKHDTDKVRQQLRKVKSQVPFAMSLTLNTLAFNTKKETDKQILAKLDRPTRYTQRAINVDKSNKRNLTAVVKVRDRNRENNILKHLFEGGGRVGKKAEGKLASLGVLPNGKYMVPGSYTPLDSFGNIRRSFLSKLIQYFTTFKPNGELSSTLAPGVWVRKFDRATKKRRKQRGLGGGFEFFVVHKQIKGGTGRKSTGQRPEPVLFFVDRPRYRQYFDMEKTARSVILRDLEREFTKNYEFATRTAR